MNTTFKCSIMIVFIFCILLQVLFDYGNDSNLRIIYAEERDMTISEEQTSSESAIKSFGEKLPEYKELKLQNDDFVGWLTVDGTKVDDPLMQTIEDKDYYLNRDFDKRESKEGTLYISDISDLYEPTDVINVYGHNMKNRKRFGSLREFEDSDFTKKHDKIWADSLDIRREYEVTYVLRIRVNVPEGDPFPYYSYSNFENEEDFDGFVKQCEEYSIYDIDKTVAYGDKFIMLTTCEYTWADGTGRLVVVGKDITKPEKPEEPTKEAVTTKAAVNDDKADNNYI